MSNQIQLARKECRKYRKDFPADKVGYLLKCGSRNWLFWIVITAVIHLREYIRSIKIKIS